MFPRKSLVFGGARSGKSLFAETLVLNSGLRPIYIATAQSFDEEMDDRVAAHQSRRDSRWQTIEAPFDIEEALSTLQTSDIALIDCATLWLTNHMLKHDAANPEGLVRAIEDSPCSVVTVSNEVGHGIVPENKLAREFRDFQGKLNQKLAEQAELAVFVAAGLPLVLKGKLP